MQNKNAIIYINFYIKVWEQKYQKKNKQTILYINDRYHENNKEMKWDRKCWGFTILYVVVR